MRFSSRKSDVRVMTKGAEMSNNALHPAARALGAQPGSGQDLRGPRVSASVMPPFTQT